MKNHQPLAPVDTNLLVYLWERHSSFAEVMKSIRTSIDKVYTAGKEEARTETLQTVRAEVHGMSKEHDNMGQRSKEKWWTSARKVFGYNKALTDLLTYLDAEIAKTKV